MEILINLMYGFGVLFVLALIIVALELFGKFMISYTDDSETSDWRDYLAIGTIGAVAVAAILYLVTLVGLLVRNSLG